ncbi:MAG TPA: thermonuclease family protein [Pseudolabrys sp.]|jgi:endonuclease YncB( thermonuclease family)|nr:thermonuclease family protein [Pseudolabrys sp.]
MVCRRLTIALALLVVMTVATRAACTLSPIGSATVAAVHDGRTLQLTDGRELRLAAVEADPSGRAMLERLAGGQAVRLMRLGPEIDRYGRLYAFATTAGRTETLQAELLKAGAARVSARVGDWNCAKTLLEIEKAARAAHRGLWARADFSPLAATDLPRIRAKIGHFVLVQGKVLSVHQSGGTIYLNFGRHWTRDFSTVILRRNKRLFADVDLEPQRLQGRRIRVRGWVELRRGPVIEAAWPEQIELADGN